jgi:hypothetical protein
MAILVGVTVMNAQNKPTESNPQVWGNPLRGAAILLRTDKAAYKVGEPVRLVVRIRNHGKEDLRLLSTDVVTTYRVPVFHESGDPVEKSQLLQRAEASSERPGVITRSLTVLKPGEETTESFELGQMVQLTEPGNYFLIAMRRLMSWDEGFLVSNAVHIKLT